MLRSFGRGLIPSVLHCAYLLHTIFASLARAHGRVHQQNVRDFPQTKLDSEINSLFFLNERGDPQFYFQLSVSNSLIKNIVEEEKRFDSGTRFLFWKIVKTEFARGPGRGDTCHLSDLDETLPD